MKTTPAPRVHGAAPEGAAPHRMTHDRHERVVKGSFYFLMIMLGLSLLYFILMPFIL